MKITLAGLPGSGKSTLRQFLADHYGLKIKATGDFMRSIAGKYGYQDITMFLTEYVSKHPEIDREVDEEQRNYGRENDDFVLDAHLGFHFVPDSIKIFLNCDLETSARRILNAKRDTEAARTIQESMEATQRRINAMRKNFKALYKVDVHDEGNFDLVIDTTPITPEQVFDQVKTYIDQNK